MLHLETNKAMMMGAGIGAKDGQWPFRRDHVVFTCPVQRRLLKNKTS